MEVLGAAVRFLEKTPDAASLAPRVEPRHFRREQPGDALVAIAAAAVNPSDVKAALGAMPYAVFPRTPGRDFSGVVIDGPADLIGREVFGSSGELGIRRDGTHASHLVVEAAALVEKPDGMTLEEAAGIGVPFVTAQQGFHRAGQPRLDEVVLVLGANGKVGQAAIQIATWRGARTIGATRGNEPYAGHASDAVAMIDSSAVDVAARVRELTDGHGADIVFNTVGDPYYAAGTASLARGGRQIFIAAVHRVVEFDIFAFYRGRHTYVGIDTLALSSVETARVLRGLGPGFVAGRLRPFPIAASAVYPPRDASAAYRAVSDGTRHRVLLRPDR